MPAQRNSIIRQLHHKNLIVKQNNGVDLSSEQSDEWSCAANLAEQAKREEITMVQLLGAKEVGHILGVNPNAVYMLWKKNLLDFWSINGTKKNDAWCNCGFP